MSSDVPDRGGRPSLTRRDLLKASTAVAGTAAVGSGQLPEAVDPIGESEAIATAVIVGVSVGAVAGAKAAEWVVEGDTDVDTSDVLEDQIYEAAAAVGEGRSAFVTEMSEYTASTTGKSPFATAAWQEIRAEVVRAFVNGEPESTAQSNALEAVQLQASRSIINLAERWNTGVTGLLPSRVVSEEEGLALFTFTDNFTDSFSDPTEASSAWSSVEGGQTEAGDHVAMQTDLQLPASPDEETHVAFGFAAQTDSSNPTVETGVESSWRGGGLTAASGVRVSHSLQPTITAISGQPYQEASSRIRTEYDNITSNIGDYVSAVYQQMEEGVISPSDILGATDIIDQFAGTGPQQRLAAEMLAIGAEIPGDKAFEAKVSHPDLAADSLWGNLFLRTPDSVSIDSLNPGQTIPSTDYHVAYLGFFSAQTGEFTTRILSGSSDLEVIDVRNLQGQEDVNDEASADAADDTSDVVVWDSSATDEEVPDPINFPADHSDWKVVVHGASGGRSIHSPTDLVKSDGTHTLESTDLNAGEAIERIQLVPPAEFSKPVEPVADPTNPGDTAARVEALREQVDQIESEFNGGGGGIGFDIGGWLGSLSNLGQFSVAAAFAGIVLVIALLSSFASLGRPDRNRE